MKRFYLLLAVLAVAVASCQKEETPKEVIPPVEEEKEVDARLEFMDAACALGSEIDDDLFLWLLENKVFFYGDDMNGIESGCSYGDIGLYGSKNGEIFWDVPYSNPIRNNRTLIMMENGICRTHGIWADFPDSEDNRFPEYEYDEKGYRNRYWRYDAETNILYTNMWGIERVDDSCAEVLYVDGRVAILKGQVMGEPSNRIADWGYFYVDFKKFDREEYMNDYDKDFTYYPEYIEDGWDPIEMDKSVLTFGPEGGEQSTTSLNYDGLWLNYGYEEVETDNNVTINNRFVDATENGRVIESSWYRVEIPEGSNNVLVVTVDATLTAIPRTAIIEFQVAGGDAFSFIEIRQQ